MRKVVKFEELPVGALFMVDFVHLSPKVVWRKVSEAQAETTSLDGDDPLPTDFLSVWGVFEVNAKGEPVGDLRAAFDEVLKAQRRCSWCEARFGSWQELVAHIESAHPAGEEGGRR